MGLGEVMQGRSINRHSRYRVGLASRVSKSRLNPSCQWSTGEGDASPSCQGASQRELVGHLGNRMLMRPAPFGSIQRASCLTVISEQ